MIIADLKDLKNTPVSFTLGSFDGLHRGHILLLNELKSRAAASSSKTLVISFYPHPRKVIDTSYDFHLLNDKKEKLERLGLNGIDYIHFINFTSEFAKTDYKEFYENYIFNNLNVKEIIAGSNHGFGKNRNGNNDLLYDLCLEHSVKLNTVEPLLFRDKYISSTRIRNCIYEGHVKEADQMLGYEYSLTGFVEKGKGLGKKIGLPTANIYLKGIEKAVPAKGVYFTKILIDGKLFFGVSNLGDNPTFETSGVLTLESHIFNFNDDIYGKEIRVFFIEKLRNETKFSSVEELKAGIENDIKAAKYLELNYSEIV